MYSQLAIPPVPIYLSSMFVYANEGSFFTPSIVTTTGFEISVRSGHVTIAS